MPFTDTPNRFRLTSVGRQLATFDTPREVLDYVNQHPQFGYAIYVANNVTSDEMEEIRLNWRPKS